ncbi:hypothetical protein HZ993_13920 [Rhodoferax sp. AJA081-3]|uniref:hypothetical protein n=1 Tax=Rhodoferax sp. AJA081-3 TaxID=2752316 RepID=UPI001AE0476E|nr:hypothetical protein [Rhodoferax sp. AJA081-3]QTN26431.1 hypothetical protein HZ993_13920 [Rhodoferax sp. AJA081-3]
MNDWRNDLNRLAVELHYGVGELSEVMAWAGIANAATGEVHSLVWDVLTVDDVSVVTRLLAEIAWDLNKFRPNSKEALPFAIGSLRKALRQFLVRERTVQSLCELVSDLDTIYVLGVLQNDGFTNAPTSHVSPSWLGDLWNCCDWCDATWSYENSQPLVEEARRVLEMLANFSLQRMA